MVKVFVDGLVVLSGKEGVYDFLYRGTRRHQDDIGVAPVIEDCDGAVRATGVIAFYLFYFPFVLFWQSKTYAPGILSNRRNNEKTLPVLVEQQRPYGTSQVDTSWLDQVLNRSCPCKTCIRIIV